MIIKGRVVNCGWAIAAHKRAAALKAAKGGWEWTEKWLYDQSVRQGFTGTIREWRKIDSKEKIVKISEKCGYGKPFTFKGLLKMGYRIKSPRVTVYAPTDTYGRRNVSWEYYKLRPGLQDRGIENA